MKTLFKPLFAVLAVLTLLAGMPTLSAQLIDHGFPTYNPPRPAPVYMDMGNNECWYVYDNGDVYYTDVSHTLKVPGCGEVAAALRANRSQFVVKILVPVPSGTIAVMPQYALADDNGNFTQCWLGANFFGNEPPRFWTFDAMDTVGAASNRPLTGSAFKALLEKYKSTASPASFDPVTKTFKDAPKS